MKKQTHSAVLFICALAAFVFCGRDASAETVTWTGGGVNTSWTNAPNWSSNPSLPATTDDVLIGTTWTSGNVAVGGTEGSPVVVNSLALQNNSAVDRTIANGYLQLTSGTLTRAVVSGTSRTIVFAPSVVFLPAGTNNWFINTSTIWWSANIKPIGGSGPMTIVKTGAGTLTFYNNALGYAGNWDYTGDFLCNAGNTLGQGIFTWRGGGTMTMQFGGYKLFTNNFVFIGGNCNFRPADVAQTNTFSGIFSGACTLFLNSQPASGSMTVLSGLNNLTNSGFVVVGETVRLDVPGFLAPIALVTMGWNTASASMIWNTTDTTATIFRNRISAGGYSQLAMNTNGTTTLTGQYSVNFNTTQGGDLRLSAVSGGTLAMTGLITDQKDYAGATISTPTNGHSLVKLGAGTVILSNSGNDYRGGTIVSNGTLLVQNATGTATGTNSVLVCGGSTLGGTGRVAGAVSILSGGRLAAGGTNVVGTLTVSNSVTFASGSTNQVDIQAGGSDKLSLTGALQLNGATLEVVVPAGFTATPGVPYTIATGFTSLDANGFAGLPDGTLFSAGGIPFVIHYNTTASPKTITLSMRVGTLIKIQ